MFLEEILLKVFVRTTLLCSVVFALISKKYIIVVLFLFFIINISMAFPLKTQYLYLRLKMLIGPKVKEIEDNLQFPF